MHTLEIVILTTAIHNHLTPLPDPMCNRNKKTYDSVEASAQPHPLVRPLHGEGKSGGRHAVRGALPSQFGAAARVPRSFSASTPMRAKW